MYETQKNWINCEKIKLKFKENTNTQIFFVVSPGEDPMYCLILNTKMTDPVKGDLILLCRCSGQPAHSLMSNEPREVPRMIQSEV